MKKNLRILLPYCKAWKRKVHSFLPPIQCPNEWREYSHIHQHAAKRPNKPAICSLMYVVCCYFVWLLGWSSHTRTHTCTHATNTHTYIYYINAVYSANSFIVLDSWSFGILNLGRISRCLLDRLFRAHELVRNDLVQYTYEYLLEILSTILQ